jgi:2-polyprenyl-3-methyl-5-hydroxy-6-metoxy-1,4-benzoquinol methylase
MISEDYKKILTELNGKENFGKRKSLPKFLESIIDQYTPKSILDFGCGTGSLIKTLREKYPDIEVDGYDPGNVNFKDLKKEKFDLIISTDVLEHIEPQHLDATLNFLKNKSYRFYHLIALSPSKVVLPDGRNAHLIIEDKSWWKNKFLELNYRITLDHHMCHRKENKLVNKYFISGFIS